MKKKQIISIALCLVLLLCPGCSARNSTQTGSAGTDAAASTAEADTQEQERFDAWCQEQFVDTMKEADTLTLHYKLENPEAYGIQEDLEDISFGTLSLANMQESNEQNAKTYDELKEFSCEKLSQEQQVTYKVLEFYLKLCEESEGFELYDSLLSSSQGIPANLPVELAEYPLHSQEDVEGYLKLLTKLPEYFVQLTAFEQEVSKAGLFISDSVLEDSLKQMREFIANPEQNYLITTFAERMDEVEGLSQKQKNRFYKKNKKAVLQYIIPAYETLIQELTALKGSGQNEGGLQGFEKGKEYYSYLAHYYTCSEMTVEEIWDILEERLDTLLDRLSDLILKDPSLYDKYDAISYRMTEPEEILVYLQKQIAQYYPDCPAVNYTVKYVDESLADSLSPAFYMVPQMDNYKDNTIYINDKSSYFHSEDLFATLAHEGFPGHLYQTTYYNATDPAPIRQILNFGGYSEGWATYVELSSYELYDFGEDDAALTDLCQIESELSLALSAMSDIGVNYKGWDRTRLKAFLDRYNMGDASTVDGIFSLVVKDPANYLQYYVSYLEFWNLRCKAKSERSDFSIKEFHQVLLDCGPAPFTVLEEQVERYIAE